MTNADRSPQAAQSGASPLNSFHQSLRVNFWIRELPFTLVLILTIGGVAYVSFSKQPIFIYWDILAPIIGLVCVWYGWPHAHDRTERLRLVVTQLLHWIAFLIVMNTVFLASVQKVLNAPSTGLAIFTLLALGTFTAGLHILSWQVCLLGLIMALSIPAIAWIENSAFLLLILVALVLGIAAAIWWHATSRRQPGSA
ncbi:MAG TPA: hypothetical protein VMF32_04005 [Xanthobacteraceae bacterium]|nr:hypothetical protein [Xanthobacteraceae bacterium]